MRPLERESIAPTQTLNPDRGFRIAGKQSTTGARPLPALAERIALTVLIIENLGLTWHCSTQADFPLLIRMLFSGVLCRFRFAGRSSAGK
jgi:hypothetical protein